MKKAFVILVSFLMLLCVTSCGVTPSGDPTDGNGECKHDYGEWVEATVTCTKKGKLGHYQCSKCNKFFDADHNEIDEIKVAATGHTGGTATCTNGCICTSCGKEYTNPLGHEFDEVQTSMIDEDGCATLTCTRDSSHTEKIQVITLSASVPKTVSLSNSAVNEYLAKAKTYDPNDFTYTYASDATQTNTQVSPSVTLSYAVNTEITYSAVPTGLTVEVSKNSDLTDAATYPLAATAKSLSLVNLETGTTYYYRATLNLSSTKKVVGGISSFTTDGGVRFFKIGGVSNARDEGGWTTLEGTVTKQGLVIRAGRLDDISDSGKKFLLEEIGVKTELDLRSDQDLINQGYKPGETEIGYTASFLGSSVRYVRISSEHNANYFVNTTPAAEAMRIFADPANYPIVVHCSGGADRTGAICTALKALLGVSENDCVADYELTNQRYRNDNNPNCIGETWRTCTAFFKALHGLAGKNFNEKMTNFFDENCGFTAMELSNIRNMMLTDSGVFLGDSLSADRENKNVFALDLRDSGGISSVTVDGGSAQYDFDAESSVLTVNNTLSAGKHTGKITFADGGILNFEIQK